MTRLRICVTYILNLNMLRFFSIIAFFIFAASIIEGVQISDKIDLDTESNPPPSISCHDCGVVNYRDGKKNIHGNIKANEKMSRRRSGGGGEGGVTVKSRYPQSKPDTGCGNPDVTVVNNIRIVLTDNESHVTPINQPKCQNNICDVYATTKQDQQGNLVTTIQFSIITRMKDIKVHDIPVIDGNRGSFPQDNFKSSHPSVKPNKPQIYRQNTNTFQPSYGVPKTYFSRPHTDTYYSYNRGISREESHGQSPWMTGRDTIDDKIEPPLSKTTSDDQQ